MWETSESVQMQFHVVVVAKKTRAKLALLARVGIEFHRSGYDGGGGGGVSMMDGGTIGDFGGAIGSDAGIAGNI